MSGGIFIDLRRCCAPGLLALSLGGWAFAPHMVGADDAPTNHAAQSAAASTTATTSDAGVAAKDDCPPTVNEKSIVVEQGKASSDDSSMVIASDAAGEERLEPISNESQNVPELADPPAEEQPPMEPTLADDSEETNPGFAPKAPGADDLPTTEDVCIDDGEYVERTPSTAAATVFEPASFNGVVPGETTRAHVLRTWGDPVAKADDGATLTYELDDFPTIVVAFDGDLVRGVQVELFEPVSADKLVDRLSLIGVRPAVVVDKLGATTSTTFPERGVTFNYRPSLAAASATDGEITDEVAVEGAVCEIVIGKIEAASFALCAASSVECDYSRQIADLETALRLDPTVAAVRARLAQLKLAAGQAVAAEKLAAAAVELEPRNDEYRLGWAKCLKYLARYDEAVRETRQVIESDHVTQLVRAQALEQLGLLAALGSSEVQPRSVPLHNKSIELADKLVAGDDPAVAAAANQLLVSAHLAVAEQIAAGNWKDKDQAVADWISRALGLAEEMITNGDADVSLRLQVAVSALASGARLDPPIDPALWIAEAEETVTALESQVDDRVARDEINWQLGLAYYFATEIQHRRGRASEALKYGALAESILAPLAESRAEMPDTNYMLGRLFFQIGAVHAVHGQDHDVACQWYDRAVESLMQPVPVTEFAGPKQHGDALVSMGVSYGQVGQKERAYELTKAGAELVQQGVAENLLAADAVQVPQHNLDAMNKALGKPSTAAAKPATKATQIAKAEAPASKTPKPTKGRTTAKRSQTRMVSRGGTMGVSQRERGGPVGVRIPFPTCEGILMAEFQPADYGPVLAQLVSGDRCRALDAGRPDRSQFRALQLATVDAAFAHSSVVDHDMAAATIAGVWLVHDFLDESHTISQNVETPTGAFWHAVMHRREGDFSNAKYWFRRVGAHDVLRQLDERLAPLVASADTTESARRLLVGGRYDPYAMVDACQRAVRSGGDDADFCRRVQQLEWELLFDFSYSHAVGE